MVYGIVMCIQGGGVGGKRAKEGKSLLGLKNKQTNVLNSSEIYVLG